MENWQDLSTDKKILRSENHPWEHYLKCLEQCHYFWSKENQIIRSDAMLVIQQSARLFLALTFRNKIILIILYSYSPRKSYFSAFGSATRGIRNYFWKKAQKRWKSLTKKLQNGNSVKNNSRLRNLMRSAFVDHRSTFKFSTSKYNSNFHFYQVRNAILRFVLLF